ncbi:sugar ABC transporter permease [Streptomyces sp. NBC_01003]|uniref:sugar ABC transporter permease n=1 Tax=Streptomyces sp. NBC_01003 TaxID=2903714 RepID=UPI00386BDD45|nr:sugar ABC transporter permease [Streptomyces sp. NBC_01003]
MSRATAPNWAAPALALVLERVTATKTQVGGRFPLFADPGSGRWTTTGRGSWTGGFWAGLLWLRARHTRSPEDRRAAIACTDRLEPWIHADTATRGLIFWYGTALADDPASAGLRERVALAVRESYDAALGLVPWGSSFGGPRLRARVDGVPGLVPLLAVADADAAASHLRRHLELCVGERRLGRFTWSWRYETNWIPQEDPPPGWSRGRAWLLLAVADAAHVTSPDELVGKTRQLLPSSAVPPADEEHPEGPLDTSAAAIDAVALLKLGHRDQAVSLLHDLVRTHLTRDGRLLNGCYDLASGTAPRHELIWGDFFLAYALAALTGLVDPHEA